jgi:NADPH:quinone reductase-like Zn-dependent oxidoreductase
MTMRAVLIRKTGGPEVLELVNDYPKPELKDGEVSNIKKAYAWKRY